MTATAQDFTMYAGDSRLIPVTVTNTAGTAKNLTGATVEWAMYLMNSATPSATKESGDGIEFVAASDGTLEIALDPADTENLRPHTYYHEAKVTDSSGNISTVLTGFITLNPSRL